MHYIDGAPGDAMPYASWSRSRRTSLGGNDARAHIEVDVLRAQYPFDGVEVRSTAPLTGLALATYDEAPRTIPSSPGTALELDVPQISQYAIEGERGWCSPASLAMVMQYHGVPCELLDVVTGTYDDAYGGTGNWTFNIAYASRFGLRGYVAYLRDFVDAQRFLDAGIPLVLSYSWSADELPQAPLEQSAGHLAVLRGFDAAGDAVLNDPAHPAIRIVYPRAALERVWQNGGGVVYAIAPPGMLTGEFETW